MKRCVHGFISEFNTQAPHFDLVIQNGGQVLLIDIYRIRTDFLIEEENFNSVERVEAFLELINRTYYDKYDLAKAAQSTFLCPRQFTNICKKITGMSFINYLNKVRVDKAKELIRDTQLPVTQIAMIVGFENLSSFYRGFKKVHDRSPLEFRSKVS
jgi:transcriptional regulator GlxA family with amidase domain